MSSPSPSSTSPTPDGTETGSPVQKKVPRYYSPFMIENTVKPRCYASRVVSSQQMMLENLRYTRRQLEKEEEELKKIQSELYSNMHTRKFTKYHNLQDKYDK